jgi:hypothetical protein
LHFNVGPGDTIGALRHKDHRPGFLVALADTTEAAVASAERAKAHMATIVGQGGEPVPVH